MAAEQWQKHGTRECVVATKDKTVVIVSACYKCCLHYALSAKAFVCCFELSAYSCCSLIRLKRIYNFCLFHAYFGDFDICFDALSYPFTTYLGLTY